ncbi:MAG: hypothetical protein ABIK91_07895 [Pseudomonadota bacterium]
MWNTVVANVRTGQQLMTPGTGIPANRQQPFDIVNVMPTHIEINIGKNKTRNLIPKAMFDAIDNYFKVHPTALLRIAAEHSVIPTVDSVDEIVRSAIHFPRAIGNYVAAILEAAGCVKYTMNGRRKCIYI